MNAGDFRRIALSLEGAEEGSHMGAADFRVGGRIFATLASEKQGYQPMLTPEQQVRLCRRSFPTFSCRSRVDGEGWVDAHSTGRSEMREDLLTGAPHCMETENGEEQKGQR